MRSRPSRCSRSKRNRQSHSPLQFAASGAHQSRGTPLASSATISPSRIAVFALDCNTNAAGQSFDCLLFRRLVWEFFRCGLRIFSQAHPINNVCPQETKDKCKGMLRARSLLCALEHWHQNRSGRESRVCKYWAALTARIPVNQSEEKITI